MAFFLAQVGHDLVDRGRWAQAGVGSGFVVWADFVEMNSEEFFDFVQRLFEVLNWFFN
jgi:hypothetical protein